MGVLVALYSFSDHFSIMANIPPDTPKNIVNSNSPKILGINVGPFKSKF